MTTEFGLSEHIGEDNLQLGEDYSSISEFLDLSRDDISKIAGVAKNSVRFDERMPSAVKEQLDRIYVILQLVADSFEGDSKRTALWFTSPNPMLGYTTPRDMIKLGRYKKLMQFIISERKRSGIKKQKEAA